MIKIYELNRLSKLKWYKNVDHCFPPKIDGKLRKLMWLSAFRPLDKMHNYMWDTIDTALVMIFWTQLDSHCHEVVIATYIKPLSSANPLQGIGLLNTLCNSMRCNSFPLSTLIVYQNQLMYETPPKQIISVWGRAKSCFL